MTKLVKNYLKSGKNERQKKEESGFDPENKEIEGKSLKKVKKNVKVNLSIYLNQEQKRRYLIEKREKKGKETKNLLERRKSEILKRKEEGWKKRSIVQKRIEDLLVGQREKSQFWDLKLSRVNSRRSNYTPRVKRTCEVSPVSEKKDRSEPDLEEFYIKKMKSEEIHSVFLRNKSEKSAVHNQQVKKVFETQLSLWKDKEKCNLMKAIEKNKAIIVRKKKKEKFLNESASRQGLILQQKGSRLVASQQDQDDKLLKKLEKLENKEEQIKFNLANQIIDNFHVKKIKSLNTILRTEEIQENLTRLNREKQKKKEEIVQKHLKNLEKLKFIKETKEKMNLKARFEAALASQQHAKSKDLKLIIKLSEDPEKVVKFFDRSF